LIHNKILMNDFVRQWEDVGNDALRVIDEVGRSGWYILGERVRSFEQALSKRWGPAEAVGVGSGLDAIELALRGAGMQPGDRVLTTPLSAFATTLAIVRSGGIPVFCDTTEMGLLDLEEARGALLAMPGIRFIVPVHLYGLPVDPAGLGSLIEEFDLICIEDCAQSIGAHWEGRATGTTGVAAATSFYPTKNLGAMGDGGAVLTSNRELADRIRALRDYGQTSKYRHTAIGWNSRLDELQAALLENVFLPRLRGWLERRNAIAEYYLEHWRSTHLSPLAPRTSLRGPWCSSWHLFPVLAGETEKAALLEYLRENGVQTGEHYPILIPDQEAMRGVSFVSFGSLEKSRGLAKREVSLPIHPYMSDGEVERVLNVVSAWK
jgi:dTDP-3-amino-3,4,6-trideoxy-alpha-D-glucose transaminase